jgi:hypothetical protein
MFSLETSKNEDCARVITPVLQQEETGGENLQWLVQSKAPFYETGTKTNRDHFVSVVVLFIIDVYMRPGRK